MKRIASRFLIAGCMTVPALSGPLFAQRSFPQQSTSVPADFIEGNLNFHRAGGFLQVTDTTNHQSAGTVIFPPGAAPIFASMPGYDIKAAYEKHMNAGAAPPAASSAPVPAAAASSSVPAAAPATSGFDAATRTATLPDGRSVTFVDDNNADVTVPGAAGMQTYHLTYHGNSGMHFARSLASANRGGIGGSMGTGVVITLAPANGMPGGQLYDTAVGSNVPASVISRVKPIVDTMADAVRLATPAQPKLADTKVVHSILHNNIYRAPGY